jgi:hypothetical protein
MTISLALQITYEVFFSQPNSFLVIPSESPSTVISWTRPNSRQQLTQVNSSSTELSQLLTTHYTLGTSRYIASGRTPRKTPSSIVPKIFRRVYWSLFSNRRPTVVRVGSHGIVFTETLPSNRYTCQNIQNYNRIFLWILIFSLAVWK